MQPTVVWTEIPVSSITKGIAFYNKVFGWDMEQQEMGGSPTAIFNNQMEGVGGHLYEGKPAAGSTLHLLLPDSLEDGIARCIAAGGSILGEPIEIPPGRFQYATDPDGNSLGLFEGKAA